MLILSLFNFFRVYGDSSLCRKVLLMGVNSASDDPERICNELLQFEREQGGAVLHMYRNNEYPLLCVSVVCLSIVYHNFHMFCVEVFHARIIMMIFMCMCLFAHS